MLISAYTGKEFEFIWRLYLYRLVIKWCDLISSDKYFIRTEYKYTETANKNKWDNIWHCNVSNVFYTLMPTMMYCNYVTLKERLFWMMQSIMDLPQPFYFVGFEVCGFNMFWIVIPKMIRILLGWESLDMFLIV